MGEEEKSEEKSEKKSEEKTEENKEGKAEESAPSVLIDNANEAAARLEKANAKKESLIDREEKLRVKQTFGGKAETTNLKPVETDKEYAERILKGEN